MDIEGHMRAAREVELAGALDAERLRTRIEDSASVLRKAFREFTDALIRYKVPQNRLVLLEREVVPASQGLFKPTPAYARMTATVLGSCWPFHRSLLFGDGSILDGSGTQFGDQIVPYSNTWGDRDRFLKLALPALSEAGLGDEFSFGCIYLVKDERGAEQLRNFDWSKIHGSDGYSGMRLSVHGTEYTVNAEQILISVSDGRYDGYDVDKPLDKVFGSYINSGMRS